MAKGKSNRKQRKNKSDRQSAYKLVSRIYRELKNNSDIYFKKLNDCQGEYDPDGSDEIILDYRKELLPTLIHEFIHKFHPTKKEPWIIKKEKFIMKRLSPMEAKRLITLLSYII